MLWQYLVTFCDQRDIEQERKHFVNISYLLENGLYRKYILDGL